MMNNTLYFFCVLENQRMCFGISVVEYINVFLDQQSNCPVRITEIGRPIAEIETYYIMYAYFFFN